MFIVIEGTDASGKATQAKLLAAHFATKTKRPVKLLSFPRYGTALGEAIKAMLIDNTPPDPLALQCMMTVDRYEIASVIEMHLDGGGVVIADRWWQSGYAYGCADGLDPDWLRNVHDQLPQADCNFLLDVPPEVALQRRPEARDRYERDREKQAVVRENYRDLWHNEIQKALVLARAALGNGTGSLEAAGASYWEIIDGSQDVEEVHEDILAALRV